MALQDFLGETSEILIFDFLADNMDRSYNQSELSEFTGLSRTTVNQKIRDMVRNNLVVVDKEVGKFKTFKLARNDIVKFLIVASMAHSFMEADNPLSHEEQQIMIRRQLGEVLENGENHYEKSDEVVVKVPVDGSITLTLDAAKKLSSVLDEKLKIKKKTSRNRT